MNYQKFDFLSILLALIKYNILRSSLWLKKFSMSNSDFPSKIFPRIYLWSNPKIVNIIKVAEKMVVGNVIGRSIHVFFIKEYFSPSQQIRNFSWKEKLNFKNPFYQSLQSKTLKPYNLIWAYLELLYNLLIYTYIYIYIYIYIMHNLIIRC